jgi:hypothetical protein
MEVVLQKATLSLDIPKTFLQLGAPDPLCLRFLFISSTTSAEVCFLLHLIEMSRFVPHLEWACSG